jgi:hypothetical protein
MITNVKLAFWLPKFYIIMLKIKVFELYYQIIKSFKKNILVSKAKKVNFGE